MAPDGKHARQIAFTPPRWTVYLHERPPGRSQTARVGCGVWGLAVAPAERKERGASVGRGGRGGRRRD